MKPLPLDELPRHSTWAAYLLGSTDDPPGDPTAFTGTERYGEIHRSLLTEYRENPTPPAAFSVRTRSTGRSEPGVLSIDEELFLATTDELVAHERAVVREALRPVLDGGETVFDLGCGWGATLGVIADAFPGVAVVGGEYTAAGVELARELHDDADRIGVEQFDLLEGWDLLDTTGGERVVFTKETVTTLPDVDHVVEQLDALAAAGDVSVGVHLEQVGPHPRTVLGLLREQYADERGYDVTFRDRLADAEALQVTSVSSDVVGANPLHPVTLLRWEAR